MTDYITYSELVERHPIVRKWHSGDGNETAVNSYCIYYAKNQVDSLLAGFYSTPFSVAHPTVKDLTFDLCHYRVMMDQDPETAEKIFDRIEKRIDRIRTGKELIITGSGTSISPSNTSMGVWSNTENYYPVHTLLDAEDPYTMVDSQQLYDEQLKRS